ncbi:MAG TPA: SpoIIE family protein phosphatase [Gemmataceae bacterium]|nr:SpoIIE family protein phosphatase [Gemmataceae bacterium]
MSAADAPAAGSGSPAATRSPVTVLLVDDQAIVGEAVRRMLAGESDIRFHFCSDPTKAIEQADAVQPTVILQDLVMPEVDGLTLVKFYRKNPATREVPLIVLSTKEEPETKADAFAVGANDYLVKLPDKVELIARIRYHSRGYIAQLERNEAYRKLAESQAMLAQEVAEAAKYVASLLPQPLTKGAVQVEWRFIPSTQLGGDSFGYHRLDADHFAFYLLDVSGHGVGASLLSVSAMNVLTAQTLPGVDFRDPGQVLAGLNNAFPMDRHNGKYFTIWYGVYQQSQRRLTWAGGAHPAALMLTGPDAAGAVMKPLESQGGIIGLMEDMPFESSACDLGPFAELLLFSDGVYEIAQPSGEMWTFDKFAAFAAAQPPGAGRIDRLLTEARRLHGSDVLGDDFSMVRIVF